MGFTPGLAKGWAHQSRDELPAAIWGRSILFAPGLAFSDTPASVFYIIWGQTLGTKPIWDPHQAIKAPQSAVCAASCVPVPPGDTPKQPKGGAGLGRAPNLPQIWVSPHRKEKKLDQRHHVLENPPRAGMGWHGEAQLCQPCLAEQSWGKASPSQRWNDTVPSSSKGELGS